jgi:methylglutaconyl-CoA hydratase
METNLVTSKLDANGIAHLTLNRPECHNAFNDSLIHTLNTLLDALAKDEAVRLLLLTAQGKNFSAGADLGWMKKTAHYSKDENLVDALQLVKLLKGLFSFPKPTIALAKGAAMGGGVGLLACADVVIAEESAYFCFSETKLGLIPATIAPYVVRAIGPRAAGYYFLTAKLFSAQEAKNIGLVHEISSPENLLQSGLEMAATLLKNGPHALKRIKQVINKIHPLDDNLLQETAEIMASTRVSKEAQEGLAAFFDKRSPNWSYGKEG